MLKSKSAGRQNFSYSCPSELFKRVVAVCNVRGCTKSWLLTKALENYLAEIEEDARDYETAAAAWKKFEESGEEPIPAEEVYKELGI